jgi:hypothetical protein
MRIFRDKRATWKHLRGGLLTAPLLLTACIANPLDETASDTSSQSTTTTGATAGGVPVGVDCGTDTTSGVTLCVGSSVCPNDEINPNDFPNCGFRTTSPSFDLECLCDGNQLCPIGIASTCADVATLVTNRTVADICNQIGAGTCIEVGGGTPTTTTTTGTGGQTGASATCDTSCASDCANVPTCLIACGC